MSQRKHRRSKAVLSTVAVTVSLATGSVLMTAPAANAASLETIARSSSTVTTASHWPWWMCINLGQWGPGATPRQCR